MKTIRQVWLIPVILLAVITPAHASEADHPERLLLVLDLVDIVPDRDMLVEAGAGEDGSALLAVAADESLRRYTRVRAVYALGLFPGAETHELLAEIALEPSWDREMRIAAVSTLARSTAPERRSEVGELLRTLANDPDLDVRETAKYQLGVRFAR